MTACLNSHLSLIAPYSLSSSPYLPSSGCLTWFMSGIVLISNRSLCNIFLCRSCCVHRRSCCCLSQHPKTVGLIYTRSREPITVPSGELFVMVHISISKMLQVYFQP